MPDHSANQIIDLYERLASKWEADRRRTAFAEREWLDRWIAFMPPQGRVLDVGCGFGWPIADYLISRGFAVTGIDSSPAMIARCRELHPEHSWHVEDMRALSSRAPFNGIIAWDSFFHLSGNDQRSMFPVFQKLAASHCALLFSSGPVEGEAVGQLYGEPLYHASLAPETYRALLKATGFTIREHCAEDPACGGHTVWLAQFESA